MKRRCAFALLLTALIIPSIVVRADQPAKYTVADEFRAGVLGFPWGTDLEQVARNFPAGVAWPGMAAKHHPPIERYYAVSDETPILGISRKSQQTMFGFDRSNRLTQAIFAIPYDAKVSLMRSARTLFGSDSRSSSEGPQQRLTWAPIDGISMWIIDIPHDTRPALFVLVGRELKE